MASTYQPLRRILGFTLDSSLRPSRLLREHENRPDTMVGRLHYSLGSTLSAHFRWSVCASERLNYCFLVPPYWEVAGL